MKTFILILLASSFSLATITIASADNSDAHGSDSNSTSTSITSPKSNSTSSSDKNTKSKLQPSYRGTVSREREKAKMIERGRRLYNANNCKTCHSTANRGGSYGPALDKLGKHANQLQLSEEIHGGADEPEMDFKTRHLTREDQRAIIEYLLSIQKK